MKVQITCCEVKEVETKDGDFETERIRYYDEIEDWDRWETTSEVYHAALKEFGRCTSKVYIDQKDGSAKHIGWMFVKRCKYEDCKQTYLRETWVVPYTKYEKKTVIECEYAM